MGEYSDKAMLAFYPDAETSARIATIIAEIEGATPIDTLHCTSIYLGMVKELPESSANDIPNALHDHVPSMPITGTISSITTFKSDEGEVVVALVDAKGLAEFYTDAMRALATVDVYNASEHGYTPHITLARIADDGVMVAVKKCMQLVGSDVTFDQLALELGDRRVEVYKAENYINVPMAQIGMKVLRRVRTLAGQRRFGKPINSLIDDGPEPISKPVISLAPRASSPKPVGRLSIDEALERGGPGSVVVRINSHRASSRVQQIMGGSARGYYPRSMQGDHVYVIPGKHVESVSRVRGVTVLKRGVNNDDYAPTVGGSSQFADDIQQAPIRKSAPKKVDLGERNASNGVKWREAEWDGWDIATLPDGREVHVGEYEGTWYVTEDDSWDNILHEGTRLSVNKWINAQAAAARGKATPKSYTREFAKNHDKRTAELYLEARRRQHQMGSSEYTIRKMAGQKRDDWAKPPRWDGTFDDALAAVIARSKDSSKPEWDRERSRKAVAEYDRHVAELQDIQHQLDAQEATYRKYGWNRAFLVTNAGGHVHKDMNCSTCYPTTEFNWLPEYSGADEIDIVNDAGSRACTVCYPTAPTDVLKRPTKIFSEDEKKKQVERDERARVKAEKDKKRIANAPTKDGSALTVVVGVVQSWRDGKMHERRETFNTERAAMMWATDAYGSPYDTGFDTHEQAAVIQIATSIAEKRGVSRDEVLREIQAKGNAKRAKFGLSPRKPLVKQLPFEDVEEKLRRIVRTREGAEKYGEEIGSVIELDVDGKPIKKPKKKTDGAFPKRGKITLDIPSATSKRGSKKPKAKKPETVDTSPMTAEEFSVEEAAKRLKKIPVDGRPDGSGTMEDPIDVGDDIEKAHKLLSEGKHIRMKTPMGVSSLIDKIRKNGEDAKAKGDKAPEYDLCRVSVPGTNLFCAESKGIPRIKMPQFKGEAVDGTFAATRRNSKGEGDVEPQWSELLDSMGVTVTERIVKASELKASQDNLDGVKVAGMSKAMSEGKIPDAPIFVTRDGYILDGHHRWAAKVVTSLDGDDVDMPVYVIDADIGYAIDLANGFTSMAGIKQKGLGAAADGVKSIQEKIRRRVRTREGAAKYGEEIGEFIDVDIDMPAPKRGRITIDAAPSRSAKPDVMPGRRKPRHVTVTDGEYDGWDYARAKGSRTKYNVGWDDELGKYIATIGDDSWDAVFEADTMGELLAQIGDKHPSTAARARARRKPAAKKPRAPKAPAGPKVSITTDAKGVDTYVRAAHVRTINGEKTQQVETTLVGKMEGKKYVLRNEDGDIVREGADRDVVLLEQYRSTIYSDPARMNEGKKKKNPRTGKPLFPPSWFIEGKGEPNVRFDGANTPASEAGWRRMTFDERIEHGVPPAWRNAWINGTPIEELGEKEVFIKGWDGLIWQPRQRPSAITARKSELKTKMTKFFAKHEARVESTLSKGWKTDPVKAAALLMWRDGLRPSSEDGDAKAFDAKAKVAVDTFGATNLQARHVKFNPDGTATIRIVGKMRKKLEIPVEDADVVAMLKHYMKGKRGANVDPYDADSSKSDYLFGVSPADTNRLLASITNGEVTNKNLRAARANKIVMSEIKKYKPVPKTEEQYKAAIKEIVAIENAQLGHDAKVARVSYIVMDMFADAWDQNREWSMG